MLLLTAYSHFPDLFVDRHEERYLTCAEQAFGQQLRAPGERRAWLLALVSAKTLAQRVLSAQLKVFVPLNALGVEGLVPLAPHCRLGLTPDAGFGNEAVQRIVLLCGQAPGQCLCAAEERQPQRTLGVGLEPVQSGFPFFDEDNLRPEEVEYLSALHGDHTNQLVSTYIAVKRAALAALEEPLSADAHRRILVSRVYPTGDVALACDTRLARGRRLMAWADTNRRLACAYVTAFDASHPPARDDVLRELLWAALGKDKDAPFAPRAHVHPPPLP